MNRPIYGCLDKPRHIGALKLSDVPGENLARVIWCLKSAGDPGELKKSSFLSCLGKRLSHAVRSQYLANHTHKRLRPLARRRARTNRPPLVAIRARNP